MKLLNKSLLHITLISVFLIVLSSFGQYYLVKSKIEKRVDKKLFRDKKRIKEQLSKIYLTPNFSYSTEGEEVKVLPNIPINCEDSLYSEYQIIEQEEILFRCLESCILVNDKQVSIKLKKDLAETQTFIFSIFLIHFLILLLIVGLLITFKALVFRKTLAPFYETIKKLKALQLNGTITTFNSTEIIEFNELNNELNGLLQNLYAEYSSEKKFIEDVSHELLTPIASIAGKLEILLQSKNLMEGDIELIATALNSLSRLTKLNQALLLLSKIENNQLDYIEDVEVGNIIGEGLNLFEDQIRTKNLKIRKKVKKSVIIKGNKNLIEILFANLIKNAVSHNLEDGFIEINIRQGFFVIKNAGKPLNFTPEEMFVRFRKGHTSKNSIGLGLSIVQKICKVHGFIISYNTKGEIHEFTVRF